MVKDKTFIIIIIAVILGLASGFVGALIQKSSVLEDTFGISPLSEIDLRNTNYGDTNLIIRNARKVVVEQNEKTKEVLNSGRLSMVSIYKKQVLATTTQAFDLSNYYKPNQKQGQGFVITADGWFLSTFAPDNIKQASSTEKIKAELDNFVAIDKNGQIYDLDKFSSGCVAGFYFWHIAGVNDLPVKGFAAHENLYNGQLVLALNWEEEVFFNNILNVSKEYQTIVKSSDNYFSQIILKDDLRQGFRNGFLFNLEGELMGFIDSSGRSVAIDNFTACIRQLLAGKQPQKASLGIYYIDLSKLVKIDKNSEQLKGSLVYPNEKGVFVKQGSLAESAGFIPGDIITQVNNIEINKDNDLARIISQFGAGERLDIYFKRGQEEKQVKIILDKFVN